MVTKLKHPSDNLMYIIHMIKTEENNKCIVNLVLSSICNTYSDYYNTYDLINCCSIHRQCDQNRDLTPQRPYVIFFSFIHPKPLETLILSISRRYI